MIMRYSQFIKESYDDVSMDYIKSLRKANSYTNYIHKEVIDGITYIVLDLKYSPVYADDYKVIKIIAFDHDGYECGNSTVSVIRKDDASSVGCIDVRSDMRRKGIGSNMYLISEKLLGYPIAPDMPHSKFAQQFWNSSKRNFGKGNNHPYNDNI